jgi:Zn-dependent M28 family amino/carboxypeptidase
MRSKITTIIVMLTVIMTSCQNNASSGRRSQSAQAEKKIQPITFNADSAYEFVASQVAFGPRVPGTPAHAACAAWLTAKLNQYGAQVTEQNFKARTYDNVIRNGINIIASYNPDLKKRILLMSHWDSRPFADHDPDESLQNTPIDGANDGASGVGVLLELARQFQLKNPNIGVDIVLFDLEDWGPPTELNMSNEEYWGLGAQYWSKNPHIFGYQAAYGILLDMVGAKGAFFSKEYFSMQYAGFVVDKVWKVAAKLGYGNQFVNIKVGGVTDDHIPVNKYINIPTIDIIHLDTASKNGTFYDYWHTVSDDLSQIDKTSLGMVGEVVGAVVYNE